MQTAKTKIIYPGLLAGLLIIIPLLIISPAALILFLLSVSPFLLAGSAASLLLPDNRHGKSPLYGLVPAILVNILIIAILNRVYPQFAFLHASAIIFLNLLFSLAVLYFRRKVKTSDTDLGLMGKGSQFGYAGITVLVALLLIWSYSAFGKSTSNGYMYKDLHATDLIHHMTVIDVLKNEIPPENVYFTGETLSYYWLSHILPAFVSALAPEVSLREVTLLASYFYALLFIAVLILFLKQYFPEPKQILILLALALLMASYKDLFVLFRVFAQALPSDIVGFLHLNYFITDHSGQEYTNYSHGWFRAFLVEPHSTLSLSIILLSLILGNTHGFLPRSRIIAALQAFLLAVNLGTDAFNGIVYGTAYCLISFYEMRGTGQHIRDRLISAGTMTVSGGIFVFCLFFLKIFKFGQSYLLIQPFGKMILLSVPFLFLDYGPLLIFGLVGLAAALKAKTRLPHNLRVLLILLMVSFFFMFFVNLQDIGSTQMIRKAGNIFRIPLLIFAGLSFSLIASRKKIAAAALCSLIALPTPFIDAYSMNTTTVVGQEYFVSAEELEAYQWMKKNTDQRAIIQDLPQALTPIPAFAGRRTALGDWEHARCYGIGVERVGERHKEIYRELFRGKSIDKAVSIVKKYKIDYVVVSARNVKKYPDIGSKFEESKYFTKVYFKSGVAIYKSLVN